MKKKLITVILSILALLCLTVGLSACGSKSTKERIAAIEDKLAELADSVDSLDTDGRKSLEEKLASLEETLKALNGGVSDSSKDMLDRIEAIEDEIDEIQLKTDCLSGRHDYNESKIIYTWNDTLTSCYTGKGCRHCEHLEYIDDTNDITYNGFMLTAVFDEDTGIPSVKLDVRDASEMTAEKTAAAVRYMLTDRTDEGYCVTLKLPKDANSYYLHCINQELQNVDSVQLTLSGIKTIYEGIFSDSSYLIGLTLGEGVKTIESNAFNNNHSLKSVTLSDSVKSVGNSAFKNCGALESITFGKGVKNIGAYAFENCHSLKSVTLPDSVESVGNSAFASCGSLESITFGKGVTALNSELIFDGCGSIKNITFKSPITSIQENNITYLNTNEITLTFAHGQKVLEKNQNTYYIETNNDLSDGNIFCERDFKKIIISAS